MVSELSHDDDNDNLLATEDNQDINQEIMSDKAEHN